MKKIIIVCLCVSMLMPLIAQESRLKVIKGMWEREPTKIKLGRMNVFNTLAPFIDPEGEFPILLKFQDSKCVIVGDLLGRALEVEEGEKHVYIKMAKSDEFFVFSIVDTNTIVLEISGDTIIYKRKQE